MKKNHKSQNHKEGKKTFFYWRKVMLLLFRLTQFIYNLYKYLYQAYFFAKFGYSRFKITTSREDYSILFGGHVYVCGHTYTYATHTHPTHTHTHTHKYIHTYRHKLIRTSRSMPIYDSHTWEMLHSESRFECRISYSFRLLCISVVGIKFGTHSHFFLFNSQY